MPDSVVHFEVVANNLKRAQEFYSKAFGWTMSPMPQFDYVMVGTTESDKDGTPTKPGAINGGMMKRTKTYAGPILTIRVEDIEKTLANVKKLGGKVVTKKQPVADMGFTAYFRDTERNLVGLWQNAAR